MLPPARGQARSPRRYTSTCTVLANAAQASRPASVSASASARADLDPDPAADRVVGAGVRVEPAGDHPDEERRRGRVVEEAHRGAGDQLRPEAHAAGVQAPEHRRAHCLRQRDAEAGRADDRHRLEHRRGAGAEAEPGAATLSHARERNTAGQRDPEAARGRGPRREERDHGHVGRSGRGARSHGERP